MSGEPKMRIRMRANGEERSVEVDVRETLLDVLRDGLGLKGPKKGCDEGVCGACSVLLDGRAVCSCNALAVEADGKEVITIEGLEKNGNLDPLQLAFMENDALQCGYCTSGQIIAARSFLNSGDEDFSDENVRRALSGNLCRCGCYTEIVHAVRKVAQSEGLR